MRNYMIQTLYLARELTAITAVFVHRVLLAIEKAWTRIFGRPLRVSRIVYRKGGAGQLRQRANSVSSREATAVRGYRSTPSADLGLTLSDARRSVQLAGAKGLHFRCAEVARCWKCSALPYMYIGHVYM